MRATVFIAGDHRMLAEALAELLASKYDVVGIVTDGKALLAAAPAAQPDLVLLDLAMPGIDSLEAARRLRSIQPGIRLIILTASIDPLLAAEALRLGIAGYVLKSAALRDLLAAIKSVLSGGVYLGLPTADGSAGRAVLRPAVALKLTSRQQEVLRLLSFGHSMKTIARMLKISPRTVAFHKYLIMQRYGLKNTAALMHFGARNYPIDRPLSMAAELSPETPK